MINIEHFIINHFHLNILLLLGLSLFGGTLGGRLFQKLRIPQVVGYIIIGLILGDTFTGFISTEIVNTLQPFNYFALGLIGFMIGGELKKKVFQKYGKQFLIILLSEGLTAFFVVSLITTVISFIIFRNITTSIALGLLLGAIASATAPAATTDVLWEYKARGPLTRTVLGIVALDDGLALVLFAIASGIAGILTGNNESGIFILVLKTIYEIGGSVVLGVILGYLLSIILKTQRDDDKMLMFSIGFVLLSIGISIAIQLDMLITAMTLGAITVNTVPKRSRNVFELTERFTPPIYVLFFVLVGAKLDLRSITWPIIFLASSYLIGRTVGKMTGAYWGAKLSGAPEGVRKFLSLCLFSQAGVAIGLSILAGQRFTPEISQIIVIVITTTTFIVQLIGPYFVKTAVIKAKEAGLNITEDDLLKKSRISEIMGKNIPVIKENDDLNSVLNKFATSDNLYFPVTDRDNNLKGIISIDRIKETFLESEIAGFLLAHDIMEEVSVSASSLDPIIDVRALMDKNIMECMPITDKLGKLEGFVERRQIQRLISAKIAAIHQQADILG